MTSCARVAVLLTARTLSLNFLNFVYASFSSGGHKFVFHFFKSLITFQPPTCREVYFCEVTCLLSRLFNVK